MRPRTTWTRVLPWMATWAIAMAFLESAVVVYLRELYYPSGFSFPLVPIAPRVAATELVREVATLVMLLAPAALVSERRLERFAWFCFGFGVWDLAYYLFLKIILDWPASLFEPDILFLVPVVWTGPVLAPCIISVGLIMLACILLHRRRMDPTFRPGAMHWVSLTLCGVLFLYCFVEEPGRYISRAGAGVSGAFDLRAMEALDGFVPDRFSWWIFLPVSLLAAGTLGHLARRRNSR